MYTSLQDYLACNPLDEGEFHRGSALRVASCFKAYRGNRSESADEEYRSQEYLWQVLTFSRGSDALGAPRLTLPFSLYAKNAQVSLLGVFKCVEDLDLSGLSLDCGESVVGECRNCWTVEEYSVRLPYSLRMFSLKAGSLVTRVDYKMRGRYIDDYLDSIYHAAMDASYPDWLEGSRKRLSSLSRPKTGPLMSIVTPAYNTPLNLLTEMIESVFAQTYENWQLVLVNASPENSEMKRVIDSFSDERFVVVECPENYGIAGNTNVGLKHCSGDYISFFDHDDTLEPYALSAMVDAILKSDTPVDMLFCDEDSMDETGRYLWPLFKPGYDPDLILSNNYVIHMLTVSRYALDRTQRSEKEVDGAQDYDLTLKVAEVARSVVRVPEVLYHWRIHSGSINANPDSKPYAQLAGQRAIEGHLNRLGYFAVVSQGGRICTYRASFEPKNQHEIIHVCAGNTRLSSKVIEELEGKGLTVRELIFEGKLTLGDLRGLIRGLSAEYVLFSLAPFSYTAEGIASLVGRIEVGDAYAVAPCIVSPDGLVQYAGTVVNLRGELLNMNRLIPVDAQSYLGRHLETAGMPTVLSSCSLVRIDKLIEHLDVNLPDSEETVLAIAAAGAQAALSEGMGSVYYPVATICLQDKASLFAGAGPANRHQGRIVVASENDARRLVDRYFSESFDQSSGYFKLGKSASW